LSVLCSALRVNPPPRLRRRRGFGRPVPLPPDTSLTAPLPLHSGTLTGAWGTRILGRGCLLLVSCSAGADRSRRRLLLRSRRRLLL